MKHLIKKTIIVTCGICSFAYSNTQIKSIDFYNNKTVLNQKLNIDKHSVDLIGDIRYEDIKFVTNTDCKILNSTFKTIDLKKSEIDKLIMEFEDKISLSENKKKGLEANIKYLQNLNTQNLQSVDLLKQSSEFITKEVSKGYDEIYLLDKKIKEYKQQIEELKKSSTNNKFTRLDYDIKCKKNNSVLISYPTRLIQTYKTNDISYDSEKKKIELKNIVYLTQYTGVDLKNVELNFYVGNYYNLIKPYKFTPLYLDVQPNRVIALNDAKMVEEKTFVKAKSLNAPVVDYVELSTRAVNRVSNVNLKLNKKTKVELTNEKIDAKDSLEIDGYSSSNVFYKVGFQSDKLYNQGLANLYLDGVDVGKNYVSEIKKDKKQTIYFGINSFVTVKKELIKDMKEEPFFRLNVLKTEKIWKYEIKNSGNKEENLTLLERVPVSKHEDIKIKLIGKTKYNKLDNNGKIYYDFILKPKETKVIEFGYQIEKPVNSK